MKRIWLLVSVTGMFIFLLHSNAAIAQVPGTVFGVVKDSGGDFPANADLSFTAYLTKDPSTTVNKNTSGNSYDEASGTWIVQLSNFPSWNIGDVLHIEFTDANGPTGVETGSNDCNITGTNNNCGDTSLPVELSLFEAKAGDGMVLIVWRTESETDNLGFHIYRGRDREGKYERITKELIKSNGNGPNAQDYKYLDKGVRNGVQYYYKLEDLNVNGERTMHGPISALPNFGLTIEDSPIPDKYDLSQNFPNPFNPGTLIQYQLPENSKVRLTIYNLLGQKVRTLVDAELEAGYKSIYWDGRDDLGRNVAAGVYLYELVAGSFVSTKKMVLMK